jgi:thiol-disulfide isomerase/thioredoxin
MPGAPVRPGSVNPVLRRPHRSLAAGVAVLGLLLAACSDDGDARPGVVEDVDDIPFETFDGETTTLADFDGPLVVNFFASWCTPCVTEMPEFDEVYRELDGAVTFIGLNYDDRADDALEIVERTGVTYPVGRDVEGALFQAFAGVGMPTTAFIRDDGTVTLVRSTAVSQDDLRELIRDELGVG